MWTLRVFIAMALKVGLIHKQNQLTTSSELESSRPTAKNKTKKLKSSQGFNFMNAWLQMTRTAKQWSARFTKQSGYAPTIKLTKNKFILGLTVNFLKKISQHQQDINLIKNAVTTRMLYQQSSTKLMCRSLWRNLVEISQCNSTILPAWSGLSVYSAQSFQLQICALIHVKVLTQTWGALTVTHINFPLLFNGYSLLALEYFGEGENTL